MDRRTNPPPRSRPRPPLRLKLLLSAMAILLPLAALEAGLWLHAVIRQDPALLARTGRQAEAPWTIHDPLLGWANRPLVHLPNHFPTDPGDVRINAQGLRADREYSPEPPPGRGRVLALGDSYTFGFDVGNGLDWPAQLEAIRPELEVLNLGVCGYGLGQIVLAYERAAGQFEHDWVVLGFFSWDVHRALEGISAGGYAKPRFRARGERLRLTGVPVPEPLPHGSARLGGLMLTRFWRTARSNTEIHRFVSEPERSSSWRLGRLLLERLDRAAAANGARLLAVDIPWYWQLVDEVRPMEEYPAELFEQLRIPYQALQPIFRDRMAEEDLFDSPDHHCNPAGYRLIAEQAALLMADLELRE